MWLNRAEERGRGYLIKKVIISSGIKTGVALVVQHLFEPWLPFHPHLECCRGTIWVAIIRTIPIKCVLFPAQQRKIAKDTKKVAQDDKGATPGQR